jgi:uncharacterized membrane protein (UPF0127 family)
MGEVAYTNPHTADPAERELAKAARARVPVPGPEGRVVIRSGGGDLSIDVERRRDDGIMVGMMFRTRFDGENRGMLFEYPHPRPLNFWMRNCRIPIDVAYILRGRVEKVYTMTPGFGVEQQSLRYYESDSSADHALEMPGGWFEEHGVKPGDGVVLPK